MALPLATTTMVVLRPGEPTRDAQRRPIRTLWQEPAGPYPAHVSSRNLARRDVAPEQQLRAVDVYLDPEAWPVLPGYRLRDVATGEEYDVQAAELRDGDVIADLAHVHADVLRVVA